MKEFSLVNALLFLAVVGLALGWSLDHRPGQPQVRFQIQASEDRAFILNTTTGQAWEQILRQGNVTSASTTEFLQPKVIDK